MANIKRTIAGLPVIGAIALLAYRSRYAIRHLSSVGARSLRWLFRSRETSNFTYDLDATNKRYLASLIADITGQDIKVVTGYFDELEQDAALRQHIERATRQSDWGFMADSTPLFGRRIGWYALVRMLRPKVVVETGVDKGLGACLLAAALKRNSEEGFAGHYYGTDINPLAGYLLASDYAPFGTMLYGDSIESLQRFEDEIDLFINDSDHSATYEAEEYRVVTDKLAPGALILGDNAHCTDKLLEFSLSSGRRFIFFQELPLDHWYPGAGIGFSFKREAR